MKIFIPIKEISQRVPSKNFRLFGGAPLYKHTLYKLKDFEVYVDTDSEEILKQVEEDENLSHVTAYRRREDLTGHEVSVCELICHFVTTYCSSREVICQVHVTSPFLNPNTLSVAYSKMRGGFVDSEFDSVVSCNSLQTRLWRKENYGMCPVNHNPVKLEQTQDLPIYYEENSLFYMFYSDIILQTNNRIGENPYFYVTNFPENLDIDTEEDWTLASMVKR